jgi:CopG family nickel-responsive transcriptional regulator
MSGKRRFGVSIPSDIADALDKLAEAVNTDRSSLVAEALRTYIHDHLHYLVPHKCLGILIVIDRRGRLSSTGRVIEKYKDIIKNYTHNHVDNHCVEIFIVNGSSSRIRDLDRELRSIGCSVRYIPLSTNIIYGNDR